MHSNDMKIDYLKYKIYSLGATDLGVSPTDGRDSPLAGLLTVSLVASAIPLSSLIVLVAAAV